MTDAGRFCKLSKGGNVDGLAMIMKAGLIEPDFSFKLFAWSWIRFIKTNGSPLLTGTVVRFRGFSGCFRVLLLFSEHVIHILPFLDKEITNLLHIVHLTRPMFMVLIWKVETTVEITIRFSVSYYSVQPSNDL